MKKNFLNFAAFFVLLLGTAQGLRQLAYISCSVSHDGFTIAETDHILESCRRNNEILDITGVLLYHDTQVFQILEGPDASVSSVLSRIRNDNRHKNVIVIMDREVPTRSFMYWRMAVRDLALIRKKEIISETEALEHLIFGRLTSPTSWSGHQSRVQTDKLVMRLLNLYETLIFKDNDLCVDPSFFSYH